MTVTAVADTHALLWHFYNDRRLSPAARTAMANAQDAGDRIALSAITLAEIVYLAEKGRIAADAFAEVIAFLDRPNALFVQYPFDRSVAESMAKVSRAEVPDMPDRIIAATALHLGVPVISRDGRIRLSAVTTIW